MYNPEHEIKEVEYTIKFKQFICGVWDGKLIEEKVMASDGFNAVAKLALYQGVDVYNIQIVSVSAYSEPDHLELNRIYTTLNGTKVIMKEVFNAGKNNETMVDNFGGHRYSRRDGCVGRCTGSSRTDGMNIKLHQSWYSKDFDNEKYDNENTNITHCRPCPVTTNHRALNGNLNHVAMDYRGYTIYGEDGVWRFTKNPHTYLGLMNAVEAEGRFDAQEKIDRLVDGEE